MWRDSFHRLIWAVRGAGVAPCPMTGYYMTGGVSSLPSTLCRLDDQQNISDLKPQLQSPAHGPSAQSWQLFMPSIPGTTERGWGYRVPREAVPAQAPVTQF